MQLKTCVFLTAIAALSAGHANANMIWDIYAGGVIGAGGMTIFADDDTDTNAAQSFGAVVGIDIPAFRFEGEYNYIRTSDLNTNIAMVNAYFKMPSTVIKPYLGIGVGASFSGEYDDNTVNVDLDTSAAYQGMLGVTIDTHVLPVKFDVEGRVLYAPDIVNVANVKPDILNYDLRLKVRYVF
ncbi:MAG: hypothetical protein IJ560_02175 [Alphaproteobacteria bacterium]|nr:hypothetical protein [Alphaproteobacteria bacterium]